MAPRHSIAFERIADTALNHSDTIVRRWLPDGGRQGREWVSLNPTRPDKRRGSFKVNLITGRWSDFATGDGGGDLVSLAAYLFRLSQAEAALRLAEMVGINGYDH